MNKDNGPWRITFDTNPDDCNLRCIMCETHSVYSNKCRKTRRRMDVELIKRILHENHETALKEIIPSTMGEPLLYKKFYDIIELCKKYNLKLNLTTNGTFPIKGAYTWGHLVIPVCSDVKISFNGATKYTQESIMLGIKWEDLLKNIKTFIKVRDEYADKKINYCKITLQLTFLEKNVQELADIVKLGIKLGVDRIKGHHLWAHFNETKCLSMRRNIDSINRWNKAVISAQKVAKSCKLANGSYIKLENIYTLNEEAQHELVPNGICPFLGKEVWVATDGRFNPCCAPDEKRRKLGYFGNLYKTTLMDIWNSEAYLQLKNNYRDHEICKKCNMRIPEVINV